MSFTKSSAKRILVALLLVLSILCTASCGGSYTQSLTTEELSYKLPTYLKQFPLNGIDAAYKNTNDTVFVFVIVFDQSELASDGLASDVTVEEYASHFISKNGFDEEGMELDLEYNNDKTRVSFDVVIGSDPNDEEATEDSEFQYYYYTFVRGTDSVYMVQMFCAEADATRYVGLFKEWSASMRAS